MRRTGEAHRGFFIRLKFYTLRVSKRCQDAKTLMHTPPQFCYMLS